MKEKWKPIPGFVGVYEVSNLGRIRSLDRSIRYKDGRVISCKGRILRPGRYGKHGHLHVSLWENNKQKIVKVHHAVLLAFRGLRVRNTEACHRDGDPSNNRLVNLRWDTRSSNNLDKRKHGTSLGRRVKRGDGVVFASIRIAAEETGCGYQNIWKVCKGLRRTAGGYTWMYA